jgi:hypothetical protein
MNETRLVNLSYNKVTGFALSPEIRMGTFNQTRCLTTWLRCMLPVNATQ